jgi:quercetin dioxygenase-like cupin family protein
MIVTRWQAPALPAPEHLKMIFEAEGLSAAIEELGPGTVIPDHRHPFDEVRFVVAGELMMNIAGNRLLLRSGDRIDIPANTKHSKNVEGNEACVCLVANRPF